MKKRASLLFLVFLCIAALGFCACSDDKDDEPQNIDVATTIIGTWSNAKNSMHGVVYTYTFNEDGTAREVYKDGDVVETFRLTYKLDDDCSKVSLYFLSGSYYDAHSLSFKSHDVMYLGMMRLDRVDD